MAITFSRVVLAGPLLTVEDAKTHTHITDAALDADVQQKLDAAEEWVLAYLGPAVDATWTPSTAPRMVKHAILMVTAYLYDHRGDDTAVMDGHVWDVIRTALGMYRDPTVA
jgi:hypothetical protein